MKDAVLAKLDQFIFSEDVQLGDVTDTFAQVAVVGPGAAASVAAIVERRAGGCAARDGRARQRCAATWAGGTAIVVRVADTGEPGFDLSTSNARRRTR